MESSEQHATFPPFLPAVVVAAVVVAMAAIIRDFISDSFRQSVARLITI